MKKVVKKVAKRVVLSEKKSMPSQKKTAVSAKKAATSENKVVSNETETEPSEAKVAPSKKKAVASQKKAAPSQKKVAKKAAPVGALETINFRITTANKEKLMKVAAKKGVSLTKYVLQSLNARIAADAGKGEALPKVKGSQKSENKDDKILFLIQSTTKNKIRRAAKKADLNLSQFIMATLFE